MTASVTKGSDVPAGLNLTSELESIILKPSILVYLEKLGPFAKLRHRLGRSFGLLQQGNSIKAKLPAWQA